MGTRRKSNWTTTSTKRTPTRRMPSSTRVSAYPSGSGPRHGQRRRPTTDSRAVAKKYNAPINPIRSVDGKVFAKGATRKVGNTETWRHGAPGGAYIKTRTKSRGGNTVTQEKIRYHKSANPSNSSLELKRKGVTR